MQEQILDLSKVHFEHRRGDIVVYGTWIKTDGRWRACMVLLRTGDIGTERAVPCVITVDKAWIWSEEVGDPAASASMAVQFAELLRFDPSRVDDVFKIVSLIQDNLGELLNIPPRAADPGSAIGELTVTNRNTGKSREVILTESD